MAPDLNSVPPSPRNAYTTSTASSRRTSQLMGPPPAPSSELGSRSSLATREPASSSTTSSPALIALTADNTAVGIGPGPLRHPRPLTAADLHLQLEQEQEAVVNRLTRELSLLRQQTASVASTASSTSTGLAEYPDPMALGASHPTPSRRHRSSSSLSTRSAITMSVPVGAVTGIAPAREIVHAAPQNRDSLSRQNSVASSRRSEASSPSLSSSLLHGDHFPSSLPQRQSFVLQHAHPSGSNALQLSSSPGTARSPSRPQAISSARYEEAALHRSELEAARQENEALRRRVKELERSLSIGRSQSHSHESDEFTRRGSTSATTGAPPTRADSGESGAEGKAHEGERAEE